MAFGSDDISTMVGSQGGVATILKNNVIALLIGYIWLHLMHLNCWITR